MMIELGHSRLILIEEFSRKGRLLVSSGQLYQHVCHPQYLICFYLHLPTSGQYCAFIDPSSKYFLHIGALAFTPYGSQHVRKILVWFLFFFMTLTKIPFLFLIFKMGWKCTRKMSYWFPWMPYYMSWKEPWRHLGMQNLLKNIAWSS